MESDKYLKALRNHPINLTDSDITEKAEKIIAEKFEENNNKEVYKKIYACIDLTTLNTTDTRESVWKFVEKVNSFEGSTPEVDNVAAICVYPNFAHTAKEALTADVKIACVSAGFPSSQTFTEVKVAETALAVADGADEIDVVLNVGLFLGEEYEELCEELSEIKEACRDATLKVILETGALKTGSLIHNAAILALYSGADFLKTSTGKGFPGATLEAAWVMCHAIKSYHEKTGRKIGLKVSGGVSTTTDAVKYYTLVKELLGEEWCTPTLFRIGTSRLADTLLSEIQTI
ncbi:MAG: deoxyribose-phosphate aldolase [Bacteroidetes bacterium GWD2_45_23]|nr:MAG: deoxyribose-phosphate aldolase [Bacteroidetes bacterium GWC2_46_850]OFX87673.1 MAG: deoxyribose-phosphate aldolase [Bacteroidetes bacterium GWD2_45_23]HBB01356.1 deoxyribose-phosphate aldolase [Porphyromonadaceae bacterium]HCC19195.1 deoxyribose-phosphate aldolase [Porphyromonadaceae bacterium]